MVLNKEVPCRISAHEHPIFTMPQHQNAHGRNKPGHHETMPSMNLNALHLGGAAAVTTRGL
jgi:hypothetical protein